MVHVIFTNLQTACMVSLCTFVSQCHPVALQKHQWPICSLPRSALNGKTEYFMSVIQSYFLCRGVGGVMEHSVRMHYPWCICCTLTKETHTHTQFWFPHSLPSAMFLFFLNVCLQCSTFLWNDYILAQRIWGNSLNRHFWCRMIFCTVFHACNMVIEWQTPKFLNA